MVALDAGDLLLPAAATARPSPGLVPPDPAEVTRRANLLLGALSRMGLAAFAPGEHDLAIGPALLRRLLAEHKIPAIAANLFDDRGRRLFDADRVVEAGGVKIGLFGLIRAAPEDADLWKSWRLEARDPAAAARAEVSALRARGATIVIALVHAGAYDEAKKILQAAPGIDWAVLGHSALNLETPDEVGGTRALEAMSMGKDFGRLDLHIVDRPGADLRHFVDRGRRAQVQAILDDHQRQITDLRTRAADQPPIMQARVAERIATLEKAIARDRALLKEQAAEIQGNWFENRILPLDTATPDHPAVGMLVAAYNRENQRRAAAGLPVGVAARSAAAPPPSAPAGAAARNGAGTNAVAGAAVAAPADENVRYAGAVACGGCHAAALAFWRTTAHARALDTLKKVKRDRDPTCVGCHVTGYLRPGGTGDIRLATARLRDVGCEACHGPGVDHVAEGDHVAEEDGKPARVASAKPATAPMGGMPRQVPSSVCLGCHTPDQTNGDFDYPRFLKAILGPGHGGV